MAMREALSWLKQNNYDNIRIETDSLLVVQGLESVSMFSSFDLLLLDIKDSIGSFARIKIYFDKRTTNQTVHLLAQESVSKSVRTEWDIIPPTLVNDLI